MKEFIENYLPENHWLTKSMELNKVGNTGSYWHLKKFIVFYYYIFVKNALEKEELVEITNFFNEYINSVDVLYQKEAEKFFFEIDI